MMRIDKRLHLVVPIYDDAEKEEDRKVVAYVHSTPLPAEAVDKHFLILARTHAEIFNYGLGVAAGPGIAMRLLKKIAENMKQWDGPDGARATLVEEMRRLSVVIVPGAAGGGWQQVPIRAAVDRGFLSEDDAEEVENAIVFFMCESAVLNRTQRRAMIDAAAGLWDARTSSLNSTEFADSLKTSSAAASTGAKSPAPAPSEGGPANATADGKPSSVPV